MKSSDSKQPQNKSAQDSGFTVRRSGGRVSSGEWQAVPGYEARRFKAGARVAAALKNLPWWAKALPAVVGLPLVVTLCAGIVAGNPVSRGFSDTETVTMSFRPLNLLITLVRL